MLQLEYFEYGKFVNGANKPISDWENTASTPQIGAENWNLVFHAAYIGNLAGVTSFPGQIGLFAISDKLFVLSHQRVNQLNGIHQGIYFLLKRRHLLALKGLVWPLITYLDLFNRPIPLRETFASLKPIPVNIDELPSMKEIDLPEDIVTDLDRILRSDHPVLFRGYEDTPAQQLLYLENVRALVPLEHRLLLTFTTTALDFLKASAHIQIIDEHAVAKSAGYVPPSTLTSSVSQLKESYAQWAVTARSHQPSDLAHLLEHLVFPLDPSLSIDDQLNRFARMRRKWENLRRTKEQRHIGENLILEGLDVLRPHLLDSEFEELLDIAVAKLPLTSSSFQRIISAIAQVPRPAADTLMYSRIADAVERCSNDRQSAQIVILWKSVQEYSERLGDRNLRLSLLQAVLNSAIRCQCENEAISILVSIVKAKGKNYDLALVEQALICLQRASPGTQFFALFQLVNERGIHSLSDLLERHSAWIGRVWSELISAYEALYGDQATIRISELTHFRFLSTPYQTLRVSWYEIMIREAIKTDRLYLIDSQSFRQYTHMKLLEAQYYAQSRQLLTDLWSSIKRGDIRQLDTKVAHYCFVTIYEREIFSLLEFAWSLLKYIIDNTADRAMQTTCLSHYFVAVFKATRAGHKVYSFGDNKSLHVDPSVYKAALERAARSLTSSNLASNIQTAKLQLQGLKLRVSINRLGSQTKWE